MHARRFSVPSACSQCSRLDDIWAVLTNPVFLWGYRHVLLASPVTAGAVMLGISVWQIRRGEAAFEPAARLAVVVPIPSTALALVVGSEIGVVEATYQPRKIAAAEAQWDTC